jgi:histone H3/H4
MNSAQIQALSQIQAQAIVNARKAPGNAQQIQTQIQLQAQALVHAHTQAQIAAGIYKGEAPKKENTSSSLLLTSLTPAQLQQQQQLTARHQQEKQAAASKPDEMAALERSHKEQVEQLHATFRKQNAAAEYAGVKVATVPNPASSSTVVATAAAAPSPLLSTTPSTTLPTGGGILTLSEGEIIGATPPSATCPQFLAKLNTTLNSFWTNQLQLVQQMPPSAQEQDFKTHNDLPLARIKRIMKSDEDVRMISAEAPVLFAKACELFILELTTRAWTFSQHHKRRTLQKEDIKEAIQRTDIFDFLVDVIQ